MAESDGSRLNTDRRRAVGIAVPGLVHSIRSLRMAGEAAEAGVGGTAAPHTPRRPPSRGACG